MRIEQKEQGLLVHLEGELGHHEALEAMRGLEDVIDSYTPAGLELDFSGVTFMDSSGIAVVVQSAPADARAGRRYGPFPASPSKRCAYFRRRAFPSSSALTEGGENR